MRITCLNNRVTIGDTSYTRMMGDNVANIDNLGSSTPKKTKSQTANYHNSITL